MNQSLHPTQLHRRGKAVHLSLDHFDKELKFGNNWHCLGDTLAVLTARGAFQNPHMAVVLSGATSHQGTIMKELVLSMYLNVNTCIILDV